MKNEAKKFSTEDILKLSTLGSNPGSNLINSVFENLPPVELAINKKQRTLERLKRSLSAEVTFGELVLRHLLEKKLNISVVAQVTGLPEKTIQALTEDTILPFSVPVVLMKRFIEYLGVQFDAALKSLNLTTGLLADAVFEDQDVTVKAGVSARRGYEISLSDIEPRTIRDRTSVRQSGERYLERLKQLTEEG